MDRISGLMELLGEDNNKRIKDSVTNFIIEAMKDDMDSYGRENYILNPEEVIDFVNECKNEAFNKLRPVIVKDYMDKIELITKESR